MAEFPIIEEYVEKFVILNEIGQWESFRTDERIVRCRDCKYHYEEEPMYSFLLTGQHMCGYWATDHKVKPDGFCSWGKPKEGE